MVRITPWKCAGTSIVCAPPPKRVTRSDMFARKMLENVLCDAYRPWEQPIPNAVSSAKRAKARKIPALRHSDVFWPWPLMSRDLLQPLWKQQHLFRLCRQNAESRMNYLRHFGFSEQQYLEQLKLAHV